MCFIISPSTTKTPTKDQKIEHAALHIWVNGKAVCYHKIFRMSTFETVFLFWLLPCDTITQCRRSQTRALHLATQSISNGMS